MQTLRNQIGQRVFPTHRLDRKTSGVLLFAKNSETNKLVQSLFRSQEVNKTYKAIVRGHTPDELIIDYPLSNNGKSQEAITHIKRIERLEINLPSHKYDTSRYSLVSLAPKTGRFHQLRKHLAHIRHPIIGDRPHGCNKQNKLWKEVIGMQEMMLCATELSFMLNGQKVLIKSPCSQQFSNALKYLRKG